MTPSEKAKELVNRYYHHLAIDFTLYQAKQCALICVDEILKNDSMGMSYDFNQLVCDTDWWEEVKQEINNL